MNYQVTIKESEVYVIEVRAYSEQEAENLAYEMLDVSEEEKAKYHHDSEGEVEVVESD